MAKHTNPIELSSDPAASSADPTAVPHGTDEQCHAEPKKKKKKYSNIVLRTVQELDTGLMKGARKVAEAVTLGLDEYELRRADSAAKKQDGGLRDMLRNQSKALRKSLPVAAEAPSDFLDAVADLKLVRKLKVGKVLGK